MTTANIAGRYSVMSLKSISIIDLNMMNPTAIRTEPEAAAGIAAKSGAKKRLAAKNREIKTATRPVRPPHVTPDADSIKTPQVVVPSTGAIIFASESTIKGFSMSSRLPSSFSRPPSRETPIMLVIVSRNERMNMENMTESMPKVRAPAISICMKVVVMSGGMLTTAWGRGDIPRRNAATVVNIRPMKIAARTLRTISISMISSPITASRTSDS